MDRHLGHHAGIHSTDRPLTGSDFAALWSIITRLGGMGFCNGGRDAGASQHHKHLQWIPARPDDATSVRSRLRLPAQIRSTLNPVPAPLPFGHAFAASTTTWNAGADAGSRCTRLQPPVRGPGIDSEDNPLPPYNLLLTRCWMLVVRRSRESWQQMSINSWAMRVVVRSRAVPTRSGDAGRTLNILKAVTAPR